MFSVKINNTFEANDSRYIYTRYKLTLHWLPSDSERNFAANIKYLNRKSEFSGSTHQDYLEDM